RCRDDTSYLVLALLDGLPNLPNRLLIVAFQCAAQTVPERSHQVVEFVAQEAEFVLAGGGGRSTGEVRPESAHFFGMGVQFRPSGFRQMIGAALQLPLGAHMADFFQILQGRVDRAGTGRVLPVRALFDGFDDLVAVPGAVAERIEQDIAELAASGASAAMSLA